MGARIAAGIKAKMGAGLEQAGMGAGMGAEMAAGIGAGMGAGTK